MELLNVEDWKSWVWMHFKQQAYCYWNQYTVATHVVKKTYNFYHGPTIQRR